MEDRQKEIAAIVAEAVNLALAGVKAEGRLDPSGDGAMYYAARIMAVFPTENEEEVV